MSTPATALPTAPVLTEVLGNLDADASGPGALSGPVRVAISDFITQLSGYTASYGGIPRSAIPSTHILSSIMQFHSSDGATYKRGTSNTFYGIQDADGGWWNVDYVTPGYCDIRWVGGVADWTGNPATSTDSTAAWRLAVSSGVAYIPPGLSFYVARPSEFSNLHVDIFGTGNIIFGGGVSTVNATGHIVLQAGQNALVISGTALTKLGLTAGTYASSVTGSALSNGAYTDPYTGVAYAAGTANPLTPINQLSSPVAVGDTIIVNGKTLTAVAAGTAVDDLPFNVDTPLWVLIDKIDAISGGGSLLRIDQNTQFFKTRIGREGARLTVTAGNLSGPSGRVLDLHYPVAPSFTYELVSMYIDAQSSLASPNAAGANTWMNFIRMSNTWFPQISSSWAGQPANQYRKDGSYAFHLTGGIYASIAATINGEYLGGTYGIVCTGYTEALRFGPKCEFVSFARGLYVPPWIARGGAGALYGGETFWLANVHFAASECSLDLSYVQHVYGMPNTYRYGTFAANWTGILLSHCDNTDITGAQAGGNPAYGDAALVMSVCTEASVRFNSSYCATQFIVDSGCVNCHVEGVAVGLATAGNAFNDLGTGTTIVWSYRGNLTLKGKGILDQSASAVVKMPAYTVAGVPSAATYIGSLILISNRSYRPATSDGTNWRFADGTIIS